MFSCTTLVSDVPAESNVGAHVTSSIDAVSGCLMGHMPAQEI